jgi:prevent-host-death family protein
MRKVGLVEAKRKLSELVQRAERGERIGIARHGKLVAVIGPIEADTDLDKLFEGMEKVRRNAKPFSGVSIKDLIRTGGA